MLWKSLSQNIPLPLYMDFFLRILVASLCGAIIGVERSWRLKEAGVRTHLLVSCTAALIIIVSKYGFSDLTGGEGSLFAGDRGADPSRIAAQVVSGISFLCAGVIFKQGHVVKGLTTAAGLWATAGIGLALGAGMYPLGIFTTAVILAIQVIMHRMPVHNDQYQNSHIDITVHDDAGFRSALTDQLHAWQAQVIESSVTRNQDGTTSYSMELKMNTDVDPQSIYDFLEQNSSVLSFRQTTSS